MVAVAKKPKKVWIYKDIVEKYERLLEENKNDYSGIFTLDDKLLFANPYSLFSIPIEMIKNKKSLNLEKYTPPLWINSEHDFQDNEKYHFLSKTKTEDLGDLLIEEKVGFAIWNYGRKLYEHECKRENKVSVGDCILGLKLGRYVDNCQECTHNPTRFFTQISIDKEYSLIKRQKPLKSNTNEMRKYFVPTNQEVLELTNRMFEEVEIYLFKAENCRKNKGEVRSKNDIQFLMNTIEDVKYCESLKYIKFVHYFSKEDKIKAEIITFPLIPKHKLIVR